MKQNVWFPISLPLLCIFFLCSCSGTKNLSRDYTSNKSRNISSGKASASDSRVFNPSRFDGKSSVATRSSKSSRKKRSTAISRKSNTNSSKSYKADQLIRKNLVKESRKYIGVGYLYGGKNSGGFDCSGLICHLYHQQDISLPAGSKAQSKHGKLVSKNKAQVGDLVFFKEKGRVSHVAMIVDRKGDDLYIIHSTRSKGVGIDQLSKSEYWSRRFSHIRSVL